MTTHTPGAQCGRPIADADPIAKAMYLISKTEDGVTRVYCSHECLDAAHNLTAGAADDAIEGK